MRMPGIRNTVLTECWLLALLAVSCRPVDCHCGDELELHAVSVALAGATAVVKAAGVSPEDENAVAFSRLYVFHSDTGEALTSCLSDSGVYDLWLAEGTYDFFAVVNGPQLDAVYATREELLADVTLLSDNAPGCFVMAGGLTDHLVREDEKITVEVRRVVAKVTFALHTDFDDLVPIRRFRVRAAYLTNVVGSATLAGRLLPEGPWFHRMECTADGPGDLIQGTLDHEMQRRDSLAPDMTLYAYPNDSEDGHDRSFWTTRCTRLVVEAQADSTVTYYPVTIPEVVSNTHYHIDITIRNLGTEHPEDIPCDHCFASVTVSVTPWTAGTGLQVEI